MPWLCKRDPKGRSCLYMQRAAYAGSFDAPFGAAHKCCAAPKGSKNSKLASFMRANMADAARGARVTHAELSVDYIGSRRKVVNEAFGDEGN